MTLLADHTTLHLGGPAQTWIDARSADEVIASVAEADAAGTPVLILGEGSNLVAADDGFAGTVIHLDPSFGLVSSDDDSCGGTFTTVEAGHPWSTFVDSCVERGLVGLESLAGIPGTVGATPIQNVGAYGADVSQTIARVRVWDRRLKGYRTFANADCQFGYRWSRFKADPGRHLVMDVTFQLKTGTVSAPIGYAELAKALGVEVGQRAPLAEVRDAVLALRRGKGMVIDPGDHDTWSAGSFFTNPVVEPEVVPAGAPSYDQGDGTVKTSAAWLIEHAGFAKGYGNERVSLSTKHTLALTNRGAGTTADLLSLAREIRDGVEREFGIELTPEPILLGTEL